MYGNIVRILKNYIYTVGTLIDINGRKSLNLIKGFKFKALGTIQITLDRIIKFYIIRDYRIK